MRLGKRRKRHAYSEEKDKGLEWEPSASNFKHHSLAELRIYGRFKAEENFVSYARCVMEAAVNLEDIKLYKNPVCDNRKHKVPKKWTWKQKQGRSSVGAKQGHGSPRNLTNFFLPMCHRSPAH